MGFTLTCNDLKQLTECLVADIDEKDCEDDGDDDRRENLVEHDTS